MRKKILIIEDEDAVAAYLGVFLEQAGYHVERAESLEKGREVAGGGQFDLVLLDIVFPDGSADDLLPFLRQHLVSTPVLLVSGVAQDDERLLKCLRSGAAGYISKSWRVDELLTQIRRALGE
jgi:DNA-binding response OmpR family regulator